MTLTPATSRNNGLPIGLTGATQATRYVGGTATVAPTTGSFRAGDFVIGQNGTLFVCTVDGSPGTWAQVGAGATTGMEILEGNGTSINNGASANLPFNMKDSGDTLLDLTTPTAPTVITAGVYGFQFTVLCSALTAGGGFVTVTTIGAANIGASLARPGTASLYLPISATVKCAAADAITVNVTNNDGATSRTFTLITATVTRIS